MVIDFGFVLSTVLGLASAAILAAIPIVVPALLKRLNIANDTDLNNKLVQACDAAAGAAYQYAAAHEGGLANVDVHNQALALALNYVVEKLPDTIKALDLTPEHITSMVSARLGNLLAADPTVTAGTPAVGPVIPPDQTKPIYQGRSGGI